MAKKSKSRGQGMSVCSSNLDRISDLPDNVLDNILMYLPIQEGGRTSILSKKWRHKWANVPQLKFDRTFHFNSGNVQQLGSNNKPLMMTIYEVLLLHSGPIHKFTLSLRGLKTCPEIDILVLFLSSKGIQEFNLSIFTEDYHKLPSHFFSLTQLRYLTLRSCIFVPPPKFEGFSRLIGLEFQHVQLTLNFKSFISNCPLLKRFVLKECTGISSLEINAPNLKSLYYNGLYKSICFKSTPNLAKVSIYDTTGENPGPRRGKIPNLIESLSRLPALKHLSVDYYFLKTFAAHDMSKRLPESLNRLKSLEMFKLEFLDVEDVSSVVGLIRNSPNLQKLHIEVYESNQDGETDICSNILETQDNPDFYLDELREITIQNFNDTMPEMEIVKLLLAKSSILRTMVIETPVEMESEDKINILKKILRFQRASPNAEIINLEI